jgi:transglutaminase-like putative cysteine protease
VKSHAHPHQLITFARCLGEALPIAYRDLPSAGRNQAGAFELPHSIRDGRPLDTQHFGEQVLSDRERVTVTAVPHHDSFGNFCHVIRTPPGRLTVSADFLVQDTGEADATAPQAEQHALEDLPVEVLIYLLGSRYCETDRLSNTAWSLFGQVRKGWPLVKAICDYVHDRIIFSYAHASPTKTAFDAYTEKRGVCRDFAHLAITFFRCGRMVD